MWYRAIDFMKKLFDRMKVTSARIVAIQAVIVLGAVYILCMPVLWVIFRLRPYEVSGWIDWSIPSQTLTDMQEQ